MTKKQFKSPNSIWDDENVNVECKEIYSYLYSKGFDKTIFHFNIGEIQKYISITNVGFRKNIKLLEKLKYLVFKEYKQGMYEIHIY